MTKFLSATGSCAPPKLAMFLRAMAALFSSVSLRPAKFTFTMLGVLIIHSTANAAMLSRLGGQAVYDTDLDITWLADGNGSAGSIFDDGFSSTDGLMSWGNANAWAASLNVGGITGWRLPRTLQPDASCTGQAGGGSISTGGNCIGSEMGHLYYLEFDGDFFPFNAPTNGILESGDPDLSLFTNIQSLQASGGIYWSETEFNASNAWYFNFNGGQQERLNKGSGHYAWGVFDGDVSLVPIPAAVWLFGSALGLLGLMSRKPA